MLLEAVSREHGRVGLVARGARGSRSRWKNMLQPFRPLLLSWSQRGELGTLSDADQVASPPALAGESLFCGMYANELMVRFLQRSDPHPALFDHYQALLAHLATADEVQQQLRLFEKQLLEATGFGMQLECEQGSERPISADAWYLYVPESGPVRHQRGAGQDENLVSGSTLLALQSEQIEPHQLPELKQLMRKLIRTHLGDKPIASQSLFF